MLSQPTGPSQLGHSLALTWALGAHWGGLPEEQRLFSSLHATLADASLNALPAEVFESVPCLTRAHLADAVRLTQSSWLHGTALSTTLATNQTVWLLLGGGTLAFSWNSKLSSNFAKALSAMTKERFESEADTHRKRFHVGQHDARKAIAGNRQWSSLVPVAALRSIMANPQPTAKMLRAAFGYSAATLDTAAEAEATPTPLPACTGDPKLSQPRRHPCLATAALSGPKAVVSRFPPSPAPSLAPSSAPITMPTPGVTAPAPPTPAYATPAATVQSQRSRETRDGLAHARALKEQRLEAEAAAKIHATEHTHMQVRAPPTLPRLPPYPAI